MVYIMSTSWFPAQQARVFGKRVLEALKKYPVNSTLSKVVLLGGVSASEEGIRTIAISEVVKGQTEKALAYTTQRSLFIAEGVDGYKYKIEVLMSAVQAMATIDLKLPEDL